MSYRRILAALVVWSAHYIPDAFTVFQVPYTYVAFVPLYAVSLWGTKIIYLPLFTRKLVAIIEKQNVMFYGLCHICTSCTII